MGVSADLGSHQWWRALSQHSRQPQAQPGEHQRQLLASGRPSRTDTITGSEPQPAPLASACPGKTTSGKRRRSSRCSFNPLCSYKPEHSSRSVQALYLVATLFLALVATDVQAHNIPGEIGVWRLLNRSYYIGTNSLSADDAVHITAILGEGVIFNCHVEFPNDHPVPYVLQWDKKVSETVRYQS